MVKWVKHQDHQDLESRELYNLNSHDGFLMVMNKPLLGYGLPAVAVTSMSRRQSCTDSMEEWHPIWGSVGAQIFGSN